MANKQVIYPQTRTTRQLYKRIPLEGGTDFSKGFTTIEDGREEIIYRTSIDIDSLHVMACSAAANKSQKSTDGPLTVEIISRRKL